MKKLIYSSVGVVFLFTIVFGILYPISLVYMGKGLFKDKSVGSFIYERENDWE